VGWRKRTENSEVPVGLLGSPGRHRNVGFEVCRNADLRHALVQAEVLVLEQRVVLVAFQVVRVGVTLLLKHLGALIVFIKETLIACAVCTHMIHQDCEVKYGKGQ